MQVFECRTCGHIEFGAAPEKCLVCRSPKTVFHENPGAIKSPADPANLSDGDKKHIPIMKVTDCGLLSGCKDVHAVVGDIEHVMDPKHYILYMDFYLEHRFISRVWLAPEVCKPAASIHLAVTSGTVTVIEGCNLHGNWMAEIQL